MTLKIRTADIELEYTDEYNIIEGQAKNHILEIINKIYAHQSNDKPCYKETSLNKNAKCKYCGGEDKGQ